MTQATMLGKWRSIVKLSELNMEPRERATENAGLAAQTNECTTSTNDLPIAIADAQSPTIRELECPACPSDLISLILLPCSHVLCEKCLEQLGEMPEKTSDLCPLCHLPVTSLRRLVTPLPPTDSSLHEESRACLTEAPRWTTWFSAAASAGVVGTMVTDDQHQYNYMLGCLWCVLRISSTSQSACSTGTPLSAVVAHLRLHCTSHVCVTNTACQPVLLPGTQLPTQSIGTSSKQPTLILN